MQSRSPLSTEIDAILQHRWFYYSITITKLQEKCLQIDSRWRGPPPCGGPLFLMGHFRQVFLLEPQKEPKRVPLLPIAREARLRGAKFANANATLRAARRAPKNPRADGLAAARGQHSTSWDAKFLMLVAGSRSFVGGDACIAPHDLALPPNPRADMESAPTLNIFWPRRGQCGGRRKSVKKNAALLHFLAFSSNDHTFGVPRGE